jgi:hypothetical protein
VSVDGGAYGNAETETRLFIVSGGQTGADRGALDAALAAGLPCGGWCPRGRRAEDGIIPARYPLRETPTAEYPQRTAWNVRDSDGTAILHCGRVDRGTALTERRARHEGRPVLLLDVRSARPQELAAWIEKEGIARLNVAGPRESRAPGLQVAVTDFLRETLALLKASVR